jgi:hypothetical protein
LRTPFLAARFRAFLATPLATPLAATLPSAARKNGILMRNFQKIFNVSKGRKRFLNEEGSISSRGPPVRSGGKILENDF